MRFRKVIGMLKFTDFKLSDRVSHFEQLINGGVYFSNPLFFSQHGTEAQRDLEGNSGEFLNAYYKNTSFLEINDVIFFLPCGINFKSGGIIEKNLMIHVPDLLSTNFNINMMHHYVMLKLPHWKQKYDVIFYPVSYASDDMTYDTRLKKFKTCYYPDSAKMEFTARDDNATWRIASFLAVDEDMIQNGKMKKIFLNRILYDEKSIVWDNDNNFRPWVYIPYDTLSGSLNKKSILHGDVIYYAEHNYPFSVGDIMCNPDCLLFAKRASYSSQYEYRAIYGGPNKSFKTEFEHPLINLDWNTNKIKYGTTIDELRNLYFD